MVTLNPKLRSCVALCWVSGPKRLLGLTGLRIKAQASESFTVLGYSRV